MSERVRAWKTLGSLPPPPLKKAIDLGAIVITRRKWASERSCSKSVFQKRALCLPDAARSVALLAARSFHDSDSVGRDPIRRSTDGRTDGATLLFHCHVSLPHAMTSPHSVGRTCALWFHLLLCGRVARAKHNKNEVSRQIV